MELESEAKIFDKVAVFVMRRRGVSAEILTFVHPLAGRQIPAGSVEQGELPVEAARREVIEETGFNGFADLAAIGEWTETLAGEAVATAEMATRDPGGAETDIVRRGHRVRIERQDDGRLLVRRLVYDFNANPPTEIAVAAGWADAQRFARRIRRSFFLASAENDGRLAWVQQADGHGFRVEWRPLDRNLALVAGQAEWLARLWSTLRFASDSDRSHDALVSSLTTLKDHGW